MSKTVLITGASRGIGKSIAIKFAKEGYNVIVNSSKSLNDLVNLCDEINNMNIGTAYPIIADVSDYYSVKNMFEEIYLKYSKIDIVINNAGISHIGLFTDITPDMWRKIIDTNLTSMYNVCSLAVPKMISNKSGVIINISSIWGSQGASCEVAYSASKGGVNSFTKALSKELGPSNIRVNAIACGAIDTSMNNWLSDEEKNDFINDISLCRFGAPEEVASLCYFLSSNEAKYITGEIVNIDGGL
jgi:3-oxoacyl-[acyl-carrier protein] reductase